MSWHHRLYHPPCRIIFRLASLSFLLKRLLECRNNPPLCVACQFGQAHCRPWRTKLKKSGSIQRPEQKKPGDGVSVDQIVSAHPGLIPQTSGFITNQRLWGIKPGCVETIWAADTPSPVFFCSGLRIEPLFFPSFRQGRRWAWPNWQDTQSGGLFRHSSNCFGRKLKLA